MKKIFLAILLGLALFFIVYGLGYAAPFAVCDPYPATGIQPDEFEVVVDGGAIVISLPETVTGGKRLHYDVSGVSVGPHTMNVKACKTDVAWGRLCSTATPLAFTRPSAPVAPVSLGLVP